MEGSVQVHLHTPSCVYVPKNGKFSLLKYFRKGCWHTKIKHTKFSVFYGMIINRQREGTTTSRPSLRSVFLPQLPRSLLYLPP